jgi:hypothetical protein
MFYASFNMAAALKYDKSKAHPHRPIQVLIHILMGHYLLTNMYCISTDLAIQLECVANSPVDVE